MSEIPFDQQPPQEKEQEDATWETQMRNTLDITVPIERDQIILALRRDSKRNISRILMALKKGKNVSPAEEEMIAVQALSDEKIKNIVMQERENGNVSFLISFLLIPVWEERMKWEIFADEEPPDDEDEGDADEVEIDEDEEPLDDIKPGLREGAGEVRRILHEIDTEHPELEKLRRAMQYEKFREKYTQPFSKPFIKTTVDYVVRHSPWFGKEYGKEDFMFWIKDCEAKIRKLGEKLKKIIDHKTGRPFGLDYYDMEEYRVLDSILAKDDFQRGDIRKLRNSMNFRIDIRSAISNTNRALADALYGAAYKDDPSSSENVRRHANECYTSGREKLPDTLKRLIELYKIYEFIFSNPIG